MPQFIKHSHPQFIDLYFPDRELTRKTSEIEPEFPSKNASNRSPGKEIAWRANLSRRALNVSLFC